MCKSIIFIVLLLISKCEQNKDMLLLKKTNNGQQIKLTLQQEFQVELDANPTTGYTWTLVDTAKNIISLIHSQFKVTSNKTRIGAPGKQQFYFKANSVGKVELKLIYHRPWEKGVAPIDSFYIFVDVKE
jgi:inhibitor of cysteine peptidase